MYDQKLFLQTVSEFAAQLVRPYEVDVVLDELLSSLTTILDLAGSGVVLTKDDEPTSVVAVPARFGDLERVQGDQPLGPCAEALRTGSVQAIPDLSAEVDRWPDFCAAAAGLGIAAAAGIPMQLDDIAVGALSLYSEDRRDWAGEDLAVAQVTADLATSCVVHASAHRQQDQLNEQLRSALSSQAIIEQAKGSVAATHHVDVERAFELIRSHARSHNAAVRSVAEAVVNLGLTIESTASRRDPPV